MKRSLSSLSCFAAAALVSVFCCTACNFLQTDEIVGSGTLKKESRPAADGFSRVKITGALTLQAKCGASSTSIEVLADDNILPILITDVHGDTLEVRTTESYRPRNPVVVSVKMPALAQLIVSGACGAEVDGLDEGDLEITVEGASSLRATGKLDTLRGEVSGAARLDAEALECKTVKLDVSGAAKGHVWATELIDADVSGAAKLTYKGKPKSANTKTSGVGSVTPE